MKLQDGCYGKHSIGMAELGYNSAMMSIKTDNGVRIWLGSLVAFIQKDCFKPSHSIQGNLYSREIHDELLWKLFHVEDIVQITKGGTYCK